MGRDSPLLRSKAPTPWWGTRAISLGQGRADPFPLLNKPPASQVLGHSHTLALPCRDSSSVSRELPLTRGSTTPNTPGKPWPRCPRRPGPSCRPQWPWEKSGTLYQDTLPLTEEEMQEAATELSPDLRFAFLSLSGIFKLRCLSQASSNLVRQREGATRDLSEVL